MAASRIMLHPFASQAAGTVNQTFAESLEMICEDIRKTMMYGALTQIGNSPDFSCNLLNNGQA
jgi:hypothetical protein